MCSVARFRLVAEGVGAKNLGDTYQTVYPEVARAAAEATAALVPLRV
ncbi:hypothetical protein ACFOVU_25440 [Nocardiopsis sediminis]|uniref:Uncharacterized protein n=1 Tax=Nocardiopsis sediminis TaxID=1778267 RepID=A0ABV8FWM8_9ACTN